MNWPFVLRSRHDADVAALNADRDRLRRRAETAEGHAATAVSNRKQVLRQNAELDAANTRLAGWNRELRRRLDDNTDAEYTARLEVRVARLTKAAARYLNAVWDARAQTAGARADLEGLGARLKASEERARQAVQGLRPDEWESRPVDGAPRVRRDTPSAELQRALDHCRALEERLAAAERQPRRASL